MLFPHHEQGIKKITDILIQDESVLAVLIGGSIAHGTAIKSSDIDIMILISDTDYNIRNMDGKIWEGRTIECGGFGEIFCDMKYISLSYLDKVIKYGNEPSRFAFDGVIMSYSKIENLDKKLIEVSKYPVGKKQSNIDRFYAQLKTWHWYCAEAVKKENKYLLSHSVNKLILFAGRLILAHNEILYPYHKWFLHELEKVDDKPSNMMAMIETILESPAIEDIDLFYETIADYKTWYKGDVPSPNMFIVDSELAWMQDRTPIDDI